MFSLYKDIWWVIQSAHSGFDIYYISSPLKIELISIKFKTLKSIFVSNYRRQNIS